MIQTRNYGNFTTAKTDGSVMDINFISLVIEIVELWDFKCII